MAPQAARSKRLGKPFILAFSWKTFFCHLLQHRIRLFPDVNENNCRTFVTCTAGVLQPCFQLASLRCRTAT